MILFSKNIQYIYSINFLNEQERHTYKRDIENFDSYINRLGIDHGALLIDNNANLPNSLLNLPVAGKSGVLINFMGHGSEFGISNKAGVSVYWSELLFTFQQLNNEDNIIINTSLMCKGHGVFSISKAIPKPFYAAFGTTTNIDAKTYYLTTAILKRCQRADRITEAITEINNQLQSNEANYEDLIETTRFDFLIA